jgi:anti-sigma regulatory factor (Ser/Thr protein kinase)
MDLTPRWLSEPFDDVRPPLQMQMVATARNISLARRRLRDWLTVDVSSELVEDLVLAVYEAMANAVEHGYADCPHGPVRLQARRSSAHILITVSDDGSWRVPTTDRFRGRGLPLMRLLTEDVHIAAGPAGTVVRLWAEAARTSHEDLAHLRSRPAARRVTSVGPPAAR